MRFCKNCGRFAADPALTHCPKCGTPLPAEPPRPLPPQPDAPQEPCAPRYQSPTPNAPSTIEYFFTLLVFSIPVVGLVLLVVWSFSTHNSDAQRNLSRAYLLRKLLAAVLLILAAVAVALFVVSMMNNAPSFSASPYYW